MYCERSVDLVRDLIREHNMQSDFDTPAFCVWRPRGLRQAHSARSGNPDKPGITGDEWIDQAKARAEINSPIVLARGGSRAAALNPAKHVRELKRWQRRRAGVRDVAWSGSTAHKFTLHATGTVMADKIVFRDECVFA
jgi:hypothetical protein